MVDLETLGTGKRAAILQIGAVKFDPFGPLLSEVPQRDGPNTLFLNLDLASVLELGMECDAGTIMWWMQNSDAARQSLQSPAPVSVKIALPKLKGFCEPWKTTKVWSKGPSFDIAILGEAYRLMGSKWGICSYVNERCPRTVLDLAGINDYAPADSTGGVYHNALDDAWKQARAVQHAMRILLPQKCST